MDPIVIASQMRRTTYFLVRGESFNNPTMVKLFNRLKMIPIYRREHDPDKVGQNKDIFKYCHQLMEKNGCLMIFPEGSHDKRRTVRNLSKGFTRILFGAFEKYPELKVTVIPVGITYQNAGSFPCKVAIHYGNPILANQYYNPDALNNSINSIKNEISNQLKELSVHIPADENYNTLLNELNAKNVDFTEVNTINKSIKTGHIKSCKKDSNFAKPFYFLIVLNSIIPWIIWKILSKKIDETEFVDTFRAGLGISLFPIFYLIQALMIYKFYTLEFAAIYFIATILLQLLYSKLSTTPTEEHLV